jgi:hypothetical protein
MSADFHLPLPHLLALPTEAWQKVGRCGNEGRLFTRTPKNLAEFSNLDVVMLVNAMQLHSQQKQPNFNVENLAQTTYGLSLVSFCTHYLQTCEAVATHPSSK